MAEVKTNHRVRPLSSWLELAPNVRAKFDYIGFDEQFTTRFVKYQGRWVDVLDTQRINSGQAFDFPAAEDHPLAKWDMIATDSFWTGLVFRFPTEAEAFRWDLDRYDYIIVGRYIGE